MELSRERRERDLHRPRPVATGMYPSPISTFTVAHQYSPINKCQAAFQMLEIQQEAEQTIIAASVSLSFSRGRGRTGKQDI